MNRHKTNKGKNLLLGSTAGLALKKKLGYVWSTIKAPYTPSKCKPLALLLHIDGYIQVTLTVFASPILRRF